MTYYQNTTHAIYELISGSKLELKIYPFIYFRPISEPLGIENHTPYLLTIHEDRYEVNHGNFPSLKIILNGNYFFSLEKHESQNAFFRKEARRGYPAFSTNWSPGFFRLTLHGEQKGSLYRLNSKLERNCQLKCRRSFRV